VKKWNALFPRGRDQPLARYPADTSERLMGTLLLGSRPELRQLMGFALIGVGLATIDGQRRATS
jgi:hypothetical protein